jgi:hypothetical protein
MLGYNRLAGFFENFCSDATLLKKKLLANIKGEHDSGEREDKAG